MNREIKFRAYANGRMWSWGEIRSEFNTWIYSGKPIMQFTGLLDKNGKEIYEGDIVGAKPKKGEYKTLICKIVFNEIYARFEAQQFWKNRKEFISLSNEHGYYDYEVIGNIFENPELLEA
jgi:uncharacterized phage protein (TIGR01671 family)